MVKPPPDPHISLPSLIAFYLRFLRVQKNMRQHEVAEILGCSIGQVSKYETGEKRLDSHECRLIDEAWKTGGLFTYLLFYAQQGPDPTWREKVRTFQCDALQHKIFNNSFIPIPFQTEEYARNLLQAGHASGTVQDVELAVGRRMALQEKILSGSPQIWLVLDNCALHNMGDKGLMGRQYEHLLTLSEERHISVRALPLNSRPHIGTDGSFWWFEMPGRRSAAFAGTALAIGRVIEDQLEAGEVSIRFDRLAAQAWNEIQSREHVVELREST